MKSFHFPCLASQSLPKTRAFTTGTCVPLNACISALMMMEHRTSCKMTCIPNLDALSTCNMTDHTLLHALLLAVSLGPIAIPPQSLIPSVSHGTESAQSAVRHLCSSSYRLWMWVGDGGQFVCITSERSVSHCLHCDHRCPLPLH